MPFPTLSNFSGMQDKTPDELARLRKELQWLLQSLDHFNVKELYTEYCSIKSKDGETIIDGPKLLMSDKQATPVLRLRQGYDDVTGDFLFELYDALGNKTVGIDSNGQATFTGTITGGVIQTAVGGNDRIVITNNSLATYKHDLITETDYKNGIAWGFDEGSNYGDVVFYDAGVPVMQFYNNLAGDGYSIKPLNAATVFAEGAWNFTYADITGLITDEVGDHRHSTDTGYTGYAGGHGHIVNGG